MDFTNPITLLIAIPVLAMVWVLLRQISKGQTEVDTGFFKFKRSDSKDLENQVIELTKKHEALQAEVSYIRNRDSLKYEYRGKLNKINKRITMAITETIESALKESTNGTYSEVRTTDEFLIYWHITREVGSALTRKGMDDFDKNGFGNVGTDANGAYSDRLHVSYLDGKVEEYIFEVKSIFPMVEERPMTIIAGHGLIDRKVVIPLDKYEEIVEKTIKKAGDDIKELYDFIIQKYRTIDQSRRGELK